MSLPEKNNLLETNVLYPDQMSEIHRMHHEDKYTLLSVNTSSEIRTKSTSETKLHTSSCFDEMFPVEKKISLRSRKSSAPMRMQRPSIIVNTVDDDIISVSSLNINRLWVNNGSLDIPKNKSSSSSTGYHSGGSEISYNPNMEDEYQC